MGGRLAVTCCCCKIGEGESKQNVPVGKGDLPAFHRTRKKGPGRGEGGRSCDRFCPFQSNLSPRPGKRCARAIGSFKSVGGGRRTSPLPPPPGRAQPLAGGPRVWPARSEAKGGCARLGLARPRNARASPSRPPEQKRTPRRGKALHVGPAGGTTLPRAHNGEGGREPRCPLARPWLASVLCAPSAYAAQLAPAAPAGRISGGSLCGAWARPMGVRRRTGGASKAPCAHGWRRRLRPGAASIAAAAANDRPAWLSSGHIPGPGFFPG